ncbi:hypothetical protein DXG01_006074 [Tephrocybe rancida]|nr:hypothetical protein DXG01_006074 [Tephrocybe rancida]
MATSHSLIQSPRGAATCFGHLPWTTDALVDAVNLCDLKDAAGGSMIKGYLRTLQREEDSWHGSNDTFFQFVAEMNDPLMENTNPITLIITKTFTTLMQYRIIDTALFRNAKQPLRKATMRPELRNIKLPTLDSKLSATDVQPISSYETIPEFLFTSICKGKRSKQVANLVMNFQTAAFQFRFLLDGHSDLPKTKNGLIEYFNARTHAQEKDKEHWTGIEIKDMSELRGLLFAAMAISPLLLLMGHNLQNCPLGKELLADMSEASLFQDSATNPHNLKYWQIMGQYQRPTSVQSAKHELWGTIWDLAARASSVPRLNLALTRLHQLNYADAAGWSFKAAATNSAIDGFSSVPSLFETSPYPFAAPLHQKFSTRIDAPVDRMDVPQSTASVSLSAPLPNECADLGLDVPSCPPSHFHHHHPLEGSIGIGTSSSPDHLSASHSRPEVCAGAMHAPDEPASMINDPGAAAHMAIAPLPDSSLSASNLPCHPLSSAHLPGGIALMNTSASPLLAPIDTSPVSVSTTPAPSETTPAEGPSSTPEPTFSDPDSQLPTPTPVIELDASESDLTLQVESGNEAGDESDSVNNAQTRTLRPHPPRPKPYLGGGSNSHEKPHPKPCLKPNPLKEAAEKLKVPFQASDSD